MGVAPDAFRHALVAEYRPGTPLGWHRDAPDFERVAGVSLGGRAACACGVSPRQRQAAGARARPRSAYLLNGAARWRWQHSIAPTPELRYSITLRTLRQKN